MGVAEAFAFDKVVNSFVRKPPQLLVVRRRDFNYLAYYSQSPAFAAVLRRYHEIVSPPGFKSFER
jgi:hypothetical protein